MNGIGNSRRGTRRGRQGFTLIELLVTIAIITILVSVGVPMYGQFSRGSAMSSASSELIGALNEARSRAVAERRSITFSRDDAGGTDGDWSGGWQSARVVGGVTTVLLVNDRTTRNAGITVVASDGANSFVFDREGRTTGARTFTICDAGDTGETGRTISMTAFGRVSVASVTCP